MKRFQLAWSYDENCAIADMHLLDADYGWDGMDKASSEFLIDPENEGKILTVLWPEASGRNAKGERYSLRQRMAHYTRDETGEMTLARVYG